MREASRGGRDTSEEDLVLQVKNSELVYKLCIVASVQQGCNCIFQVFQEKQKKILISCCVLTI